MKYRKHEIGKIKSASSTYNKSSALRCDKKCTAKQHVPVLCASPEYNKLAAYNEMWLIRHEKAQGMFDQGCGFDVVVL